MSVKSYTTAEVVSGELVSTTETSGTVVLPVQVTIVSTEEAYADELLTEEGELITTEDILAVLEALNLEDARDDYTVALNQVRIELESVRTDYEYTIHDLNIEIKRLEEDVQALKELSTLRSSRQDDYEDAVDDLEALLEEKEDLAIPSSLISETDSLFIVADRTESYIDFDVYEQYADQLTIGGEMKVTIGSDTMKAKIVKIGKIASMDSDGLSAMITVRARPLPKTPSPPAALVRALSDIEKVYIAN